MQQVPKRHRLFAIEMIQCLQGPPRPELYGTQAQRLRNALGEHIARHRDEPSPEACGRAGSVRDDRLSEDPLDDSAHRVRNATKLPTHDPAIEVNSPEVFLKTTKSTIDPIEIIIVADDTRKGRQLRRRGRTFE